jgi:hypothetical protein
VNVRRLARVGFALIVVAMVVTVGNAMVTADASASDPEAAFVEGEQAVDPPGETTVVTTSQSGNNYVVAFAPDGTVAYYDDEYAFYNEVERVPGTNSIVYVATERLDREECHATEPCNRNVIERVNLTTGERELLYERTNPRTRNQWHAIALLDDEGQRIAVGDIAFDRVFVVDTETGLIDWEWDAQTEYDRSSGGIYPGDWTHLNDVQALPDGRLMVSLRNQDQVVFLHPETGLQENWTLGADGDHSTLYEQHNPDFIPASGGGPAVLVADSENNRIVEYERVDGGEASNASRTSSDPSDGRWVQTWEWSDLDMRWPRDADRLPDGGTMVVDSNGARVFELDRHGEVVWQVEIKGAYDVERFDVPADRQGLETARELGLPSSVEGDNSARNDVREPQPIPKGSIAVLDGVLPSILVNGMLYVLPPWFGIQQLAATVVLAVTGIACAGAELRWRGYRLRSPIGKKATPRGSDGGGDQ